MHEQEQDPDRLQEEWEAWEAWRAWRRAHWRRRAIKWGVIGAIWGGLALGLLVLWGLRDLPRPESALDAVRKPSLMVQDAAGADIASYGDLVGEPLRLGDLPDALPKAAVSVEDRRFWNHHGIDFLGVARAGLVDLRGGRLVQGGSSITQQVAKTLFLSNARTWRRKLQELVLTLWLERTFSKREILEIWLNRVYLGQGAWGVDAAAHLYFGVSARRVNLWQAAMLAGLPRAPSRFNPRTDAGAAVARTRQVLAAMVQTGAVAQAGADAAVTAMQAWMRTGRGGARGGGWFADWASGQAAGLIPADADATLRTTLDPGMQARAQAKLVAVLEGPGVRAMVGQGAVVVLDAQDGAVRAMVGGRDYQASAYNRAVTARRQPGSAFKPFVWLNALEHGASPDDAVLDAPIRIGGYAPGNFSGRYLGTVTMEEALALSINTASVRLLLGAGGARAVAAVAARLGIGDALPDNASLALGTGEVGLLELAGAYAAFCNGGRLVRPYGVAGLSVAGRAVAVPGAGEGMVVVDAARGAMMERMLHAVVARGTGVGAAVAGHDVMGKTGTAQDFRDAWFVGCVDHRRVIGVWLGNDDHSPMRGVEGGSLPAAVFRAVAG